MTGQWELVLAAIALWLPRHTGRPFCRSLYLLIVGCGWVAGKTNGNGETNGTENLLFSQTGKSGNQFG
uniref:Putative secreted protein n=1 Tax=Anopheles marajoara TaxID=58244 RepID=A0A2M4CFH3_9DIPT